MKLLSKRSIAVGVATVAAVAGTALPASAASNHGVSGTVYSPCSGQIWFEGGARTKEGTGLVKLQFSTLNPGGVTWKLLGQSNQQYGSVQSWIASETGIWRTLDSSMGNGTIFFNDFKEYDGQCGHGNYNFAGTEYY